MPRSPTVRECTALIVPSVLVWATAAMAFAGADAFRILITSDIASELEAPKCCGDLAGGVPGRVSLVRSLRAQSVPTLLLDAGDMFHPHPEVDSRAEVAIQCRATLLADVAASLRYDAIALGDSDIARGAGAYAELVTRSRAQAICANLIARTPVQVAPAATLPVGKYRVGVTSVLDAGLSSVKTLTGARLRFEQPRSALTKVVAAMRGRVDLVVVLAHVGRSESLKLAAAIPGIDVLVVAHSRSHRGSVSRVGATLVVEVGELGKMLAQVRVRTSPTKRRRRRVALDFDGELIRISPWPAGVTGWEGRIGDYFEDLRSGRYGSRWDDLPYMPFVAQGPEPVRKSRPEAP